MIRAVIFDFDGLLIDSESIWDKTDKTLLGERNILYSMETREKIRGLGQKESIELFKKELGLSGETKKLIEERRRIFYKLALTNLRLLDGAEEFVKNLSQNFVLAIATGGHKKEKVLEILSRLNLADYFSTIVSSDEVSNGKPHPDIFIYTAEKLGVLASQCLVLEDAVNGVLAGKRAGMTVFGVNKDEKIREKLKETGADKVFSSLNEVEL